MTALLALLPCAVVLFAVMVLRLSGLLAAGLALGSAVGLWALGLYTAATTAHFTHAVSDALVLELLVGFVIFFGLLFVEVSSRGGGLEALGQVVHAADLTAPRAIILIALGFGVMLESLTGYGVSMFVTVPLLLQRLSRGKSVYLALIGMSLMTWGALSIASLLGAQMAGVPLPVFAAALLTTSGPVAALLPLCCLLVVPKRGLGDFAYALLTGAVLLGAIALTSGWVGIEVAGVGGGLAVIGLSLLFCTSRRAALDALASPALWPYALLIVAVVVQKPIVRILSESGLMPVIETERVSFRVIESPGLALLAVAMICLIWQSRRLTGTASADSLQPVSTPIFRHVVTRSWRALVSIFLFLVTARLLMEIGAISALSGALSQLGPSFAAVLISLLGAVGAYVTGSGVTANALFMPGAAATGAGFDALPLFAALQHSAAAHTAMASLPVIAILLAALPDREATDDRIAMRTGLGLACGWVTLVILSGLVQLAVH